MRTHRQDASLAETLADPLIRAVMAADRVDLEELHTMLNGIVATLSRRSPPPQLARCSASGSP